MIILRLFAWISLALLGAGCLAAPVWADPAAPVPGLRLTDAVRTALANNPDLLARLQEVGVSKADLVTAGLVNNPLVFASDRFPGGAAPAGSQSNTEYSISFDFLDLALRGLRTRVAGLQLQQAQAGATEAVNALTAKVTEAWYDLAAQQQILAQEQVILDGSQAASDLAQRQFDAGNISALDLNRQKAETSQIEIDVAGIEGDLHLAQSRLRVLLGEAPRGEIAVSGTLPPLPAHDPDEAGLETRAVASRPLATVARLGPEAAEQSLALQRKKAGLGEVRLGMDTETEVNGVTETGPNLSFALPIFNHNQGGMQRQQARLLQSRQRLLAVKQQIRLEVSSAYTHLETARRQDELYEQQLVPIRQRIMEQSQLHYNNMLLSVYTLLTDREAEAQAMHQQVEAQRNYWQARAELDRSVGSPTP
ncbi:MAG: TolC family protein [Candidatus Xenobia bacterium]